MAQIFDLGPGQKDFGEIGRSAMRRHRHDDISARLRAREPSRRATTRHVYASPASRHHATMRYAVTRARHAHDYATGQEYTSNTDIGWFLRLLFAGHDARWRAR